MEATIVHVKCIKLIYVWSTGLKLVRAHLKRLTEQIVFYQRCLYSNALSPKIEIKISLFFTENCCKYEKNCNFRCIQI